MTTPTVKPTQADRKAAWPFRPGCYKDNPTTRHNWNDGVYDKIDVIQAFAAHAAPLLARIEELEAMVRRFAKCRSCKDGIASAVINDAPRNYTCLVCNGDGLHSDARALLAKGAKT